MSMGEYEEDLNSRTYEDWQELEEKGFYMADVFTQSWPSGGTFSWAVLEGKYLHEDDEVMTPTKFIKVFDTLKEAEEYILKNVKKGKEMMIFQWMRTIFNYS